jgi:predicted acetyltransferase
VASAIRPCAPGELGLFLGTCFGAFGGVLPEGDVQRLEPLFEPDRLFLAVEAGATAGSAGTLGFRLSVPGGELPCAGVTMVGVLPGHRRRGVFLRLMEQVLEDVRARGEPLAVLWSTEGDLYGRFGFGLSALAARIDVARDRAELLPAPVEGARVRLVGPEEALALFPPVFDAVRSATPGLQSRSEAWWRCWRLPGPPGTPASAPPLSRALLELDGEPAAYALYRVRGGWETGVSTARLDVLEAMGASAAATAEIWRFLFGLDLVERVRALHLPVDHPLPLLVREPARLRLTLTDGFWTRLLDVPAALAGRSYAEGEAVLELADPLCPWNEWRWLLQAAAGDARVERTDRPADARLAAAALGSAYLGGFTFERLARAGRVEELRPGSLRRLDALFRPEAAPWCAEEF